MKVDEIFLNKAEEIEPETPDFASALITTATDPDAGSFLTSS